MVQMNLLRLMELWPMELSFMVLKLRNSTFMTSHTLASLFLLQLVIALFTLQPASAEGYVTGGVKKATKVTVGGVKKGTKVTVGGVKKGVDVTVGGTKKGLRSTKNFFKKVF